MVDAAAGSPSGGIKKKLLLGLFGARGQGVEESLSLCCAKRVGLQGRPRYGHLGSRLMSFGGGMRWTSESLLEMPTQPSVLLAPVGRVSRREGIFENGKGRCAEGGS
jgi:hypothetical protein